MWLFIPSNCVLELECSEKASGLHSTISALSTEPFVTWSGKPVQPANLSRLWKRERLMKRLSGLTLSRSTAQHGADAFIASLPVSPARIYRSRAGEQDSTANAPGFSSMSSTLRMLAVRNTSFWRTCQASLLPPPPLWTKPKEKSSNARLPESWASWPTAAGMRNACLYERPTSVQIISANDGFASHGAWLTPNVPNGGRSVPAEVVESRGMTQTGKRTVGLESEVRHWATPDCNTASYSNGKFGPNIRQQASSWATPDANALERTNRSGSPNATVRPTLALAAAQWATPTSSENSNRTTKMAPSHGNGHGIVLAGQACQWATPKASEMDRGVCPSEIARRSPALLTQTATWATPTARDHKDGATTLENVEVNGLLGRQVLTTSLHPVHSMIDGQELSPTARTLRQRLNPAFACWLMGWPIWWTNPAITNSVRSETALWRSKLQQRLSNFFGAPGLPDIAAADEAMTTTHED